MTITYPLTLPDTTSFASVRILAKTTVGLTQSPFSYKQQVYKFSGEFWEADVQLVPMKRNTCEDWISFLTQLKGIYGTFYLNPDPNGLTARGTCSVTPGTPIVNGAHSARANTLSITNAGTSQTNYFKSGDYISIGTGTSRQLLKVLQNTNTDSSGNCVVDIFPALRTDLSGSESITVSNATGVFRLASNEMNWNVNHASVYGISFTAIEAL
tara:strand:- start:532 stop:1167 length:636 start_codon:yes stop_codon:yes gene_type:complete